MTVTEIQSEECPICLVTGLMTKRVVAGRDAVAVQCPRCGSFEIDALAEAAIRHEWDAKRYLISAATRAGSQGGAIVIVRAESIAQLISPFDKQQSVSAVIDQLMLLLADTTPTFGERFGVLVERDYPLLALKGIQEMQAYLVACADLGLIRIFERKLTVEGWRRVEQLRALRPNSRRAFVAMWFNKEMDAAWRDGFDAALKDTEYYEAVRIDLIEHNDMIDDRILAEIKRSGLLVADLTGNRQGVYFEAGFAAGLGIPVIWTCRQDALDRVHFDTRQFNFVLWSTPEDLRARLLSRIRGTVMPRQS